MGLRNVLAAAVLDSASLSHTGLVRTLPTNSMKSSLLILPTRQSAAIRRHNGFAIQCTSIVNFVVWPRPPRPPEVLAKDMDSARLLVVLAAPTGNDETLCLWDANAKNFMQRSGQ